MVVIRTSLTLVALAIAGMMSNAALAQCGCQKGSGQKADGCQKGDGCQKADGCQKGNGSAHQKGGGKGCSQGCGLKTCAGHCGSCIAECGTVEKDKVEFRCGCKTVCLPTCTIDAFLGGDCNPCGKGKGKGHGCGPTGCKAAGCGAGCQKGGKGGHSSLGCTVCKSRTKKRLYIREYTEEVPAVVCRGPKGDKGGPKSYPHDHGHGHSNQKADYGNKAYDKAPAAAGEAEEPTPSLPEPPPITKKTGESQVRTVSHESKVRMPAGVLNSFFN